MLSRVFVWGCLAATLLISPVGAQAVEPVQGFAIVGPAVVLNGNPFKITVIETDENGNPVAPGSGSTVTLSAFESETGAPLAIAVSGEAGASFAASGDGTDDVVVTLTGATPGTFVFIQAAGYGVGPSGPDARPVYVANQTGDVAGDPLPPGFTGAFWARFQLLNEPEPDEIGWSNPINTTGVRVFDTALHVEETVAGPGDLASVEVRLTHPHDDVAGVQFRIANDPRLDFQGIINHLEHQNFAISSAPVDGNEDERTILMVSFEGNTLPPGEHVLMQLLYRVGDAEDGVAFGDSLALTLSHSMISDPDSRPVDHGLWDGAVIIARRGDLAGGEGGGDGVIDVVDVVALINILIGRDPAPEEETLAFFRADMNGDGALDILDAVRMVNVIIGRATARPIAGSAGPAQLELGDPMVRADGQTVIPVRAQFDGAIAGLQLTFTYDASALSVGPAIPSAGIAGMTVEQHISDGTLRLVIFSLEGRVFRTTGLSTLVNLPVRIQDRAEGRITLSQAVIAGPQAERVPATIGNGTVRASATPSAFSLANNRPNPFNPSTRIEYEVPQQAHITLAVYNILGQEVARLVDEIQTPGRYAVTWNGRNAQGFAVASGVYLYRLVSSTGYTQTRRMTLLK